MLLLGLKVKVRALLKLKGMFVLDAFRAFDSDRDGLLSCSELYGGLDWLGLSDITPDHVYDLVRAIDSESESVTSSQRTTPLGELSPSLA